MPLPLKESTTQQCRQRSYKVPVLETRALVRSRDASNDVRCGGYRRIMEVTPELDHEGRLGFQQVEMENSNLGK